MVGRVPLLLQGHGHSLCGLSAYSCSLCWLGTNTSRWRARKQSSCGEAEADAAQHLCLPVKPLVSAIACHSLPGQRAVCTKLVCSLWTNSALPVTAHFTPSLLRGSTVAAPCVFLIQFCLLGPGKQFCDCRQLLPDRWAAACEQVWSRGYFTTAELWSTEFALRSCTLVFCM